MTLGGGVPDVRLVPTGELARALRRVLRRSSLEVLSYGDPEGPMALRRAVAKMVAATRGVAAREDHVLVARGSQMGVDLVARTLLAPGDVVAVEALGYRPAWEALRASGANLVPVPVDGHGIDVGALERLASEQPIRGVYVTPHHQFPTTVTLAPARRLRLLNLAREKRFWVLEDDYDHEFHYEGRPVLPLASADVHGVVVYVGTLSKVLAPGMRIGFVVAPVPVIERLAATRRLVDRQGDHLLATAIAELVEEGESPEAHPARQAHLRRAPRAPGVAHRDASRGRLVVRAPERGHRHLGARRERRAGRCLGDPRSRGGCARAPAGAPVRVRRQEPAVPPARLRAARGARGEGGDSPDGERAAEAKREPLTARSVGLPGADASLLRAWRDRGGDHRRCGRRCRRRALRLTRDGTGEARTRRRRAFMLKQFRVLTKEIDRGVNLPAVVRRVHEDAGRWLRTLLLSSAR